MNFVAKLEEAVREAKATMNSAIDSLSSEARNLSERIENLEVRKKSIETEIKEYSDQILDMVAKERGKIIVLERDYNKLKSQAEEVSKDASTKFSLDMQVRTIELEKEKLELLKQIGTLAAENAALKQINSALEAQVTRTEDKSTSILASALNLVGSKATQIGK